MTFPHTEEVEKKLLPLLYCTNHGAEWEFSPYKEDGSEVNCVTYRLPNGRSLEIDAFGFVVLLEPDENNAENIRILFSGHEPYSTAKKIYETMLERLKKADEIELHALREACLEFLKKETKKEKERAIDELEH